MTSSKANLDPELARQERLKRFLELRVDELELGRQITKRSLQDRSGRPPPVQFLKTLDNGS